MAINFNDVLDTKAGAIERPPLLPMGTYRARVSKIPAMDTVGKEDEWDTVDFPMKIISAGEDVDQDDLAKFGSLDNVVRGRRFMFNKNDKQAFDRTLYGLKRFLLDHLKVDGDDNTSLKELLNNSLNHECFVFVKWTPDKTDPEVQYDQISKTAPLD